MNGLASHFPHSQTVRLPAKYSSCFKSLCFRVTYSGVIAKWKETQKVTVHSARLLNHVTALQAQADADCLRLLCGGETVSRESLPILGAWRGTLPAGPGQ